jgi:hypothetical protein
MPINNSNENKKPEQWKGRFLVYTSDSAGSNGKLNNRLIPINSRRQNKGIGAASFNVLRKNRILDKNPSGEDNTPKAGQYVWILDTKDETLQGSKVNWNILNSPTHVVFYGRLRQVTLDAFKGEEDYIGYAAAEEIGMEFTRNPMKTNGKDYPPFNPYIPGENGGFYANMSEGGSGYTNLGKFTTNSKWPADAQANVWSLKEAIEYCAGLSGISSVKFPWDSNTEKEFAIFNDKTKCVSYPSPVGLSLNEWLASVLEAPFDYYYDYTSSFETTLVIFCESPIAVSGLCAPASGYQFKIDDKAEINVNVTDVDEVYDEVILEGDNILFAGTVTTDGAFNKRSLKPGWTSLEAAKYVAGSDDEAITDQEKLAEVSNYRKSQHPRVFQYFKWIDIETAENPFVVPKNALRYDKEDNSSKKPFFPTVYFNTKDIYARPLSTVPGTLNSSSHPNRGNLKFAPELPIKIKEKIKDEVDGKEVDVDSENRYYKPTVFAPTLNPNDEILWFEPTKFVAGGEGSEMSFDTNGIWLKSPIPETFSWDNEVLFYDSPTPPTTGVPTIIGQPVTYWDGDEVGVSERNPNQSEGYPFRSHWARFLFTIAAFSNQKLFWRKRRSTVGPDGSPVYSSGSRIKVISDPSLQLHMVHPNTYYGIDAKNLTTKLLSVTGTVDISGTLEVMPTAIRNDMPQLLDNLEKYCSWYFSERKSAKIDYALNNTSTDIVKIGQMIKELKDGKIITAINSVVNSIEIDYSEKTPRFVISTQIPELPILKRMESVRISPSAPQPIRDTVAGVVKRTKNQIDGPTQPTIESVRGGSSQSDAIRIYTVVGGNEIFPGQMGVKRMVETIPSVTLPVSGDILPTTILPDGIGSMINIESGKLELLVNDNRSLTSRDLMAGDRVFASSTIGISGTSEKFYLVTSL